ncbi:response regulator [Panacibacter ginsenosidivorans]|uniref:Response regulator n=2 Tax=Panacibacter ginsenosidivorans TaxID=1813871 RepID=A0A5B8VGL4_9BACT|nr:response regulator [Panacibacter ginsenosidivorans]
MSTNSRQVRSCLIDDDFIHQFGMKRMIQRYQPSEGVIEFSNGLDAINFFKTPHSDSEIPELIFLDINMPVMNGWEFMDEFVKIRSTIQKKIDIYILSSSTDSQDIQKAKSNPEITDYIVKPLTPDLLKNIFLSEKEKEQIH